MSQKLEFVERAAKGEKIAALCRQYGVSRQTGHKWIKRFEESGYEGLEEQSRRPKTSPLASAEELVLATLQAREAHPRWGPYKLSVLLRRRFGDQTPSKRTIARILLRANMVRERRKRARISVIEHAPTVVASAPNDVWTVDFKGWWRTLNGDRCEPLTVRDAASRFVLAVVVCASNVRAVRAVFEPLFRRHGLPRVIQCDNGVPFVSVQSRAGISRLSAWWISLGIRLVRSRPGCPQDNGGHERMHADVRADVQAQPAETRQDHNARSIAGARSSTRSGRTRRSVARHPRRSTRSASDVAHGRSSTATRSTTSYVASTPTAVRFRNDRCVLRASFAGQQVGIQVVDALRVRAWLHDVDLGLVETLPAVDEACFDVPSPRRSIAKNQEKAVKKGFRGDPLASASASHPSPESLTLHADQSPLR